MVYKVPELELVGNTKNLILGDLKAPLRSFPEDVEPPIYVDGTGEEGW